MRFLLRPICVIEGWLYSVRYWLRGGVLWFSIAGHTYVLSGSYRGERDGGPVFIEKLACERCGHISESWSWW